MKTDLISGNITRSLLGFAAPMMIGNLLQQIYSIADTLIVGKVLGENALAAVGSTYTLTTFLYSVIIGMCMGSGGLVSYCTGKNDRDGVSSDVNISFVHIGTWLVYT